MSESDPCVWRSERERERDKTKKNNVRSRWRWNMIKDIHIYMYSYKTHRIVLDIGSTRNSFECVYWKDKQAYTEKKRYTRWLKTHFKLINDFSTAVFLTHSLLLSLIFLQVPLLILVIRFVWEGSKTGKNEIKHFSLRWCWCVYS